MLKNLIRILSLSLIVISLFACKKQDPALLSQGEKPNLTVSKQKIGLDFVTMHNFVIDSISSQYTPFFFVKEGEFDISGDNNKKVIKVTCTCMDGTTVEDVDLFFSMVLNYIGFNAAEQDYNYKAPSVDKTGTYLDFGTVFNTYDLELHAKTESGDVLRNDYIKAGTKIPVESKYWSE